jgi:hypothetical protein
VDFIFPFWLLNLGFEMYFLVLGGNEAAQFPFRFFGTATGAFGRFVPPGYFSLQLEYTITIGTVKLVYRHKNLP